MRHRKTQPEIMPAANIAQPVSAAPLATQPPVSLPATDGEDNSVSKSPKPKAAKKPRVDTEKLIELEQQSREVLFKANSVFPFILFPHTIILDRAHLTIIHRVFFGIAKITSVRIEDILTADLHVGPFFGSLRLATRFFINQDSEQADSNEIKAPAINFLWKQDALEVHKLLQGFIAATHKEIDVSEIPKDKLVKLLRGLGANDDTRYEGKR